MTEELNRENRIGKNIRTASGMPSCGPMKCFRYPTDAISRDAGK